MLVFLDRLCTALLARDAEEIRLLLAHPLAHALPARVHDEAAAIADADAPRAPIHALHLYHQTAHLLGVIGDPATDAARRQRSEAAAMEAAAPRVEEAADPGQLELALGAGADPRERAASGVRRGRSARTRGRPVRWAGMRRAPG